MAKSFKECAGKSTRSALVITAQQCRSADRAASTSVTKDEGPEDGFRPLVSKHLPLARVTFVAWQHRMVRRAQCAGISRRNSLNSLNSRSRRKARKAERYPRAGSQMRRRAAPERSLAHSCSRPSAGRSHQEPAWRSARSNDAREPGQELRAGLQRPIRPTRVSVSSFCFSPLRFGKPATSGGFPLLRWSFSRSIKGAAFHDASKRRDRLLRSCEARSRNSFQGLGPSAVAFSRIDWIQMPSLAGQVPASPLSFGIALPPA
jgi:hypothetical protein